MVSLFVPGMIRTTGRSSQEACTDTPGRAVDSVLDADGYEYFVRSTCGT